MKGNSDCWVASKSGSLLSADLVSRPTRPVMVWPFGDLPACGNGYLTFKNTVQLSKLSLPIAKLIMYCFRSVQSGPVLSGFSLQPYCLYDDCSETHHSESGLPAASSVAHYYNHPEMKETINGPFLLLTQAHSHVVCA